MNLLAIGAAGLAGGGLIGLAIGILRYRPRKTERRWRLDRARVTPDHKCVSCGSYATYLRLDGKTGLYVCADRKLCRQTMIYRNMLDSVP